MNEHIQQLIAVGSTDEALELLVPHSSDALLLQARFRAGKKQYNMGLIEYSEWQRTQAQINYAALELLKYLNKHSERRQGPTARQQILLAFNPKDNAAAQIIREFLGTNGISGLTNFTQKNAPQLIQEFAADKGWKSQFILVLVSANSLREGWPGLERHLDIFSNSLTQGNAMVLALDKTYADPGFIEQELHRLEEKIDELDAQIQQVLASGKSVEKLESEKADLLFRYNNLPSVVKRLRNAFVTDLTRMHGPQFESGMQKVLEKIQWATERSMSVSN